MSQSSASLIANAKKLLSDSDIPSLETTALEQSFASLQLENDTLRSNFDALQEKMQKFLTSKNISAEVVQDISDNVIIINDLKERLQTLEKEKEELSQQLEFSSISGISSIYHSNSSTVSPSLKKTPKKTPSKKTKASNELSELEKLKLENQNLKSHLEQMHKNETALISSFKKGINNLLGIVDENISSFLSDFEFQWQSQLSNIDSLNQIIQMHSSQLSSRSHSPLKQYLQKKSRHNSELKETSELKENEFTDNSLQLSIQGIRKLTSSIYKAFGGGKCPNIDQILKDPNNFEQFIGNLSHLISKESQKLKKEIQNKDNEINSLKENSSMFVSPEVKELTSSLQQSINFYSTQLKQTHDELMSRLGYC